MVYVNSGPGFRAQSLFMNYLLLPARSVHACICVSLLFDGAIATHHMYIMHSSSSISYSISKYNIFLQLRPVTGRRADAGIVISCRYIMPYAPQALRKGKLIMAVARS